MRPPPAATLRLSSSRIRPGVILLFCLLLASQLVGCANGPRRHRIIDRRQVKVDLVREVKGFKTQEKGYEHPAVVSKERLTHILGAVEVETREKDAGIVRQPAFHPDIVEPTAEALAEAFGQVGPNEEIGVLAIRKQRRIGIFHNKFLTSFLAYMEQGQLYLILRRVDWQIPQAKEKDPLPRPSRDRQPMNFRIVSGDHMFYIGPQALEIAWQDPVFRKPYKLPGSTQGTQQRREILVESPVTEEERQQIDQEGVSLGELTPDQLRALADLEEDRRSGKITEAAYQRARRQLLRSR